VSRRKRSSDRPPDVEIGAHVKARKLRFRTKPDTTVEFRGGTQVRREDRIEDVELDTDSSSERRNLPDEVEPGVTYRDVEVGWRAQARARLPEEEEADERDDER
jgi:hypothetical protein